MPNNQHRDEFAQNFFWDWVKQNQSQWLDLFNSGASPQSESENHDPTGQIAEQWQDIWGAVMQKFFNIPQIGLTRLYQEKVNQANETCCQFQSTLGSFCLLLSKPLEKAYTQLQEQLADAAKQESLPDDATYYYENWIKILEGQYQELLNSTEYIKSLAQTLESMNAFIGAREAVISDMLKTLPIPSNKDMDALYREIYQLKKRVKTLEKSIASRKFPILHSAVVEA